MKIKLINRRLSNYRKEIFKKLWENYKAELSMSELAEIVRYKLPQFYKIVSTKKKKKIK